MVSTIGCFWKESFLKASSEVSFSEEGWRCVKVVRCVVFPCPNVPICTEALDDDDDEEVSLNLDAFWAWCLKETLPVWLGACGSFADAQGRPVRLTTSCLDSVWYVPGLGDLSTKAWRRGARFLVKRWIRHLSKMIIVRTLTLRRSEEFRLLSQFLEGLCPLRFQLPSWELENQAQQGFQILKEGHLPLWDFMFALVVDCGQAALGATILGTGRGQSSSRQFWKSLYWPQDEAPSGEIRAAGVDPWFCDLFHKILDCLHFCFLCCHAGICCLSVAPRESDEAFAGWSCNRNRQGFVVWFVCELCWGFATDIWLVQLCWIISSYCRMDCATCIAHFDLTHRLSLCSGCWTTTLMIRVRRSHAPKALYVLFGNWRPVMNCTLHVVQVAIFPKDAVCNNFYQA